jgi:hypothetical protein
MSAPDEIPAELMEALTRLWRTEQPLLYQMLPRDAWTIIGLVQYASRNPQISPTQRAVLETFGRELGRAIVAIDPVFAKWLEAGWNPQFDVPRENG